MPRKTATFMIEADGRDKGKAFLLTEMPASQAEKWASRALLAMARSGVMLPDNLMGAGFSGLVLLGLCSLPGLRFEDAEPLLDEMFGCIQFMPDKRPQLARALIEDDIEEVATRLRLREEVMVLHTGFSLADALSKLVAPALPGNTDPT